jgi:hypothetical protein
MKTQNLPLEWSRPANPLPHREGQRRMRKMVRELERKFYGK